MRKQPQATKTLVMSAYAQWAIQLVLYFFGTQSSGQRVRLMVTKDVLDLNFASLGGTNGFLAAMLEGPGCIGKDDGTLYHRGLRLHEMWKSSSRALATDLEPLVQMDNAPPFLPYLCLLCLAWTEEGDEEMAGHAYYDRLAKLYPKHDFRNRLGDWHVLWEGLENWTNRVKDKRRGHFVVEILGGFCHVGIPRSQVIFTPAKIDRLPDLFFQCSLEPGAVLEVPRLREILIVHSSTSEPLLGHGLFSEIQKNTPLGQSALGALLEHLENWDGEVRSRTGHGGGGCGSGEPTAHTILLALQPTNDNTQWVTTFVTTQCDLCEKIDFRARGWKLRMISETFAEFVGSRGVIIDATSHTSLWTSGFRLNGEDIDEAGEVKDVPFVLPARRIRIFDRWVGQPAHLLECKSLPTTGPAFVLVHSDYAGEWHRFRELGQQTTEIQDVTWTGLPITQKLFCIHEVSSLDSEARSAFPVGLHNNDNRSRALRLVAGTRCNTGTARRAYAEYDPPMLVVEGPPNAVLTVTGASAKELDVPLIPKGMMGSTVRTYSLAVGVDEAVVMAHLTHGDSEIGAVAFGVHRDHITLGNVTSTILFDRLGDITGDVGARGLIVPHTSSPWSFCPGPCNVGEPLSGNLWDSGAIKFTESLSLQNGRLTYPEYKRRAVQIAKVEPWHIAQEAHWLAELGFIDLNTDSHGRWSHVHPLPLHLYPLPLLAEDKYQFVLTGTGPISCLKKVVRVAEDLLECEVRVVTNRCRTIPPRITFLHREYDAGEQLADEANLQWIPEPPGNQFATWAGGIQDWQQVIRWFPDPGPRPSAEYSPEEFRFIVNQEFAAPWHLRRFVDPYTAQKWHCLYQPSSWSGEHGERHAFIRDFTWAMWRVHMVLPEDEITNLAYDNRAARLIVPYQLSFPYLLGRGLAVCSGLPPELLSRVAPYMDRKAGVLLSDAVPYAGQCSAYQLVPKGIADKIAGKLNARLVNV